MFYLTPGLTTLIGSEADRIFSFKPFGEASAPPLPYPENKCKMIYFLKIDSSFFFPLFSFLWINVTLLNYDE